MLDGRLTIVISQKSAVSSQRSVVSRIRFQIMPWREKTILQINEAIPGETADENAALVLPK